MKRSTTFLAVWLVVAIITSGLFILPTPPGGVEWPYHTVVASIPVAAFLCARYTQRISLIVCFGLIAGFLAAWPYFTDGRTHLRIERGVVTAESIAFKVAGLTLLMPLVCAGAFTVGRRLLIRNETHAG